MRAKSFVSLQSITGIIIAGLLIGLPLARCADTGLNDRLDCVIENVVFNESLCRARDCIWSPVSGRPEVPSCYFDTSKYGYQLDSPVLYSDSGARAHLTLSDTARATKFVSQLSSLTFEATYLTDRIVRFKLYDPNSRRYEVPAQANFPLLKVATFEPDAEKRHYQLAVDTDTKAFHFHITRRQTGAKLFDTSIGGLIFSEQFIQIATYLGTSNVYGMGENTHTTLRHDLNYRTWPIFTKDNFPGHHEKNLYGHHPFYTALESDGKSHGVLLLNSNAMEYSLLPYPALSYKTIGGILDFFVFVGETPEHVVQLYTSLIGRTFMPSFWALGFQICKYGYHNTSHVKSIIDRTVAAKIPYDVQYVDSDYKHISQDFTLDTDNFADLPKLIADTQRDLHLHWTPIIDPAIQGNDSAYQTFADGYEKDVFITWPTSVSMAERQNPPNVKTDRNVMYGRVWPDGPAGYPDYFKNATQNWWVKNFEHLYRDLGWRFDALWIDMNEPSNFNFDNCWVWHRNCYYLHCPNNTYDNIPVKIKALWVHEGFYQLSNYTLCMTAIQGEHGEYKHYDVHSLYGWSMAIPSARALHEITGKRGFVLSRSTYVSSGRYTGHWLGDNESSWPDIKDSIIGMLEFNFFGMPYIGADICGFNHQSTADLCLRWQQLGAFYPFSRNHKENGVEFEQDPAVWTQKGHPEVTAAARDALYVRYTLLAYLYTLFYRAHRFGDTVVRPLFHEYPTDNRTHTVDQQFLWGASVLVSPFLFQNQTENVAYLPNDVWYELRGNTTRLVNTTGWVSLPDSPLHPPIHFRGGSIIPVSAEKKAVNTRVLQESPIELEVYPKARTARGELFWDDGEALDSIDANKYNFYEFELLANCSVVIRVVMSGYNAPQNVSSIVVANTRGGAVKGSIDGVPMAAASAVDSDGRTWLTVNINLQTKKAGQQWLISWTADDKCNLI